MSEGWTSAPTPMCGARRRTTSSSPGAVFHYGWGSNIGTPAETVVGVGNNVAATYDDTGAATIMTSPVSGNSYFSFRDITGTPGAIFAVGNDGFNTGSVAVTVTKGVQTYTVSATDLDANVTTRSVRLALEPGPPLFADGFESGNTSMWSSVVN